MSSYAHSNLGYKWILCVIDVYSKKVWCYPLKHKTSSEVVTPLSLLIKDMSVEIIQSDNGKEFNNAQFEQMCLDLNIKHINSSPYNPRANGCVERFNKTLKQMIFTHFTMHNTTVWKEYLDLCVDRYNNTVHQSTGAKPSSQKRLKAFKSNKNTIQPMYKEPKVGDSVRLSLRTDANYRKKRFDKSYTLNWGNDIYTVQAVKYHEGTKLFLVNSKYYQHYDLMVIPSDTVTTQRAYSTTMFNRPQHIRSIGRGGAVNLNTSDRVNTRSHYNNRELIPTHLQNRSLSRQFSHLS